MQKKILYIVNDLNFFISHRLDIALAAQNEGYEIHLACPITDTVNNNLENIKIHHISLSRSGTNPFREILTFLSIYKVITEVHPSLVHLITIKPVLYGGIITSFFKKTRVVFAIPGLGFSFIQKGIKALIFRGLISILYRLAFRGKRIRVIFQNKDDKSLLQNLTNLNNSKVELIKGSGVNLEEYSFSPIPEGEKVISMLSRMQKDKGVIEFLEAASILKNRKCEAQFNFIGKSDISYASKIDEKILNKLKSQGNVNFLGYRDNINELIADSTVVVLPSYREGFPKVLQEAAACGRPIVTSDVPGCREAVADGENGFLVEPRNSQDLADKIQTLIEDKDLLKKMGLKSREIAEREFSIKKVVSRHLEIYSDLFRL